MSAFSPKQSRPPQQEHSNATRYNAPARLIGHQEHPILNLQRTIGNQAVLRALQVGHHLGEATGSEAGAAAPHSGFTYNFASIPVHAPVRGIQRKLTVNTPGDAYEQEADRVAEQVMRMREPQAESPQVSGRSAGVQRECACGGTCNDCKQKNQDEEHVEVQMKAAGPVNAGGVEAPPIVHEVLRSPGQPLDAETRQFMEPRFGQDFSHVRVHTDAKAAESARAVGARAYTVGSNVVFGAGEYAPLNQIGRKLISHELTHFVQQNQDMDRKPASSSFPSTLNHSFGNSLQMKPGKDAHQKDAPVLKGCEKGWTAGTASTWKCGEKGMGTTCEGCGVFVDEWPENDSCRKTKKQGDPKSCLCTEVTAKIGTQIAAYKPKHCGGKLNVMNRETGEIKVVTVVDAGPYEPGRIIDLHEDVFGANQLINVCVSPYGSEPDSRLQNCWDGFGGVAPATKPEKKHPAKKPHES